MHLRPRTHGESFVGRGGAPGSRRLAQSLFEVATPEPAAAADEAVQKHKQRADDAEVRILELEHIRK